MLNALDAMPHGGELDLEVRVLEDPPRVQVRMHDTGPGIAAPILARLFEPFVSGKETGVGLGLSICRRLLEAHGGSITGANAPQGGAVFTFTLYAEKNEEAVPEGELSSRDRQGAETTPLPDGRGSAKT